MVKCLRWPARGGLVSKRRLAGRGSVGAMRCVSSLLGVALVLGGPGSLRWASGDEVEIARVDVDADGSAAREVRAALGAFAAGDGPRGAERLVEVSRVGGSTPVELALAGALAPRDTDTGLHWPVRRLAQHLLAILPMDQRQASYGDGGRRADIVLRRARSGNRNALVGLVEEAAALPAGASALLVDATLALEEGRSAYAARRLDQWLELHGREDEKARAAVEALHVDALSRLDDAGALAAARRALAARGPAGKDALEHLDRRADERARTRRDRPPFASARERGRLPATGPSDVLAVLWQDALADPLLSTAVEAEDGVEIRWDALVDDTHVLVHLDRQIRCYDLTSGQVVWTYPDPSTATHAHAPEVRYPLHDLPVRSFERVGDDLVLAVLGDPAADGGYLASGKAVEVRTVGEHFRTHLVALERRTGRLRWFSGGTTEADPVLGDPLVGCCSPPLVVGDAVYALFGRIGGEPTLYAACLDAANGAVRWTTRLAAGTSGRAMDRTELGRFATTRLHALPWGARPALAGNELCVVPHAGFAAGLDATSGRLRWLRALPRFPTGHFDGRAAEGGFSARNAPWPHGDAWILAPLDCPAALALERGTGRLRWRTSLFPAHGPWATNERTWLAGLETQRNGKSALVWWADRSVALDPSSGEEIEADVGGEFARPEWADRPAAGLPWVGAEGCLAFRQGRFEWLPRRGLLPRAQPVEGHAEGSRPAAIRGPFVRPRFEAPPTGLQEAQVHAWSGGWVLLGEDRLLVLGHVTRPAATDETAPAEATRLAARNEIRAWLEAWSRRLPAERTRAAEAAVWGRTLGDLLARLEPSDAATARELAAVAIALPADVLAGKRPRWAAALWAAGAPREAQVLLERGLDEPLEERRLLAAALLRLDAALPAVRAERFAAASRALQAATPTTWHEVVRRHPGTPAAGEARARMTVDALARGDAFAAASALADLRLDPPPGEAVLGSSLPPSLEARALLEADLWIDAWQEADARDLLESLRERIGLDLRVRGRSFFDVVRRANDRFASFPLARTRAADIRLEDGSGPAESRRAGTARYLGLAGPGADLWRGWLPFFEGATFGVAPSPSGNEPVRWPARHRGWFGGELRGAPSFAPGGGVLVGSVVANEPADRSGLRALDWLVAWDGIRPLDLDTLMECIAAGRPGRMIQVEVLRNGRLALDRFRIGERPPEQEVAPPQHTLWVEPDGGCLVVWRRGVDRVHIEPPRRDAVWSLEGPGVVERVLVRGRHVYLIVRRRLFADALVAVDKDTGREVWRRPLAGRATTLVGTGSAIVVGTEQPERLFIHDAADGMLRANLPLLAPYAQDSNALLAKRGHSASFGHLFVLATADEPFLSAGEGVGIDLSQLGRFCVLAWIDTTTGIVRGTSPVLTFHGRQQVAVASGAYAVVANGERSIAVLVPPIGSAGTARYLNLDSTHLNSEQPHHGALDVNSVLEVRGRQLIVLRMPWNGEQPIAVSVFEHVRSGEPPPVAAGAGGHRFEPAGSAFVLAHLHSFLGGARGDRYTIDMLAYYDGVAILGALLFGEPHVMEACWIAFAPDVEAGPRLDGNRSRSLLNGAALHPRRHAAVRVGQRFVVPHDGGADVWEGPPPPAPESAK